MIFSDKGEYWRLLKPGKYFVKAQDDSGHSSEFKSVIITSEVQMMNFILDKGSGKYFYAKNLTHTI